MSTAIASVKSVAERLAERNEQRALAAAEEFDRLVVDLADGMNFDDDVIESVLSAAEKSADDLQQAVAQLEWERNEVAIARTLPDLLDQRQLLEEELERKQEELGAAIREIEDRLKPLRRQVSRAENAARNVTMEKPPKIVADALRSVQQEIKAAKRFLNSRVALTGWERERIHANHGGHGGWAGWPGMDGAEIKQALAAVRQRAADLDAQKAAKQIELESLEAKLSRVRQVALLEKPTEADVDRALAGDVAAVPMSDVVVENETEVADD